MAQQQRRITQPDYNVIFNPPQSEFAWKTQIPPAEMSTFLADLKAALPTRQYLDSKKYWKAKVMSSKEVQENQLICEDCGVDKFHASLEECRYHPEVCEPDCWSKDSSPCATKPAHSFVKVPQTKFANMACPPKPNPARLKYKAVALDTESSLVGPPGARRRHVVRVSAVDIETGKTLLDVFVQPTERVTAWLTGIHGIDASVLNAAHKSGNIVLGVRAAHAALFHFIDENTILAGHALDNDLNALEIICNSPYDTQTYGRLHYNGRCMRLNHIARWLVRGAVVQQGHHSCIEDAAINRECVLAQILGYTYPRYVTPRACCGDESDDAEVTSLGRMAAEPIDSNGDIWAYRNRVGMYFGHYDAAFPALGSSKTK